MSPSRALNEEAIFKIARHLDIPEARQEYLRQICGGDTALYDRVEVLLQAHGESSRFLESPPPGIDVTANLTLVSEQAGDTIGKYKLLQQIGEGGFGVVYMAQQSKPVNRKVALKIIKPGMDTKEVIARFEAERQALAMMDHPSIARVFDAGATDSGRPFFVMELVKGKDITQFCDTNSLSTHDRLKLFARVCSAVQHAHQKGVIHRDLKPSNILVTLHDGDPVPKVIDFGVSKALDYQLTERTMFTRYGQMIGTPTYMSPEQAEMSGLDVDTRSDVYSLGVLLYELLTGRPPFDPEELKAGGLDGMRQIIREAEPACPSNLVKTLDIGTASTIASDRAVRPEVLGKLLHGELDWIVMRALDKERARRYQSVAEFSEDVGRFLAGDPVKAGPPTWTYRAQKAVRKHRGLVAFSGAFFCVLLLALTVSATSWHRESLVREQMEQERNDAIDARQSAQQSQKQEEEARIRAEAAARRAEAALELMLAMISTTGRNPNSGTELSVSQALDRLAETLPAKKELSAQSIGQLNHAIALGFLNVGKFNKAKMHFETVVESDSIEKSSNAEALRYLGYLNGSIELIDRSIKLEHERDASHELSLARSLKAMLLLEQGQANESIALLDKAFEDFDSERTPRLLPENPHIVFALAQSSEGNPSGEEKERTVDHLHTMLGSSLKRWLVESQTWVAFDRPLLGDFVFDQTVDNFESSRGFGERLQRIAQVYADLQDYGRSNKVAAISHQMLNKASRFSEAAWMLIHQARYRAEAGNLAEAEEWYRKSLDYLDSVPFKEPWTQWFIQQEFASILWRTGRRDEAREIFASTANSLADSILAGQRVWDIMTITQYAYCAKRAFGGEIPQAMQRIVSEHFSSPEYNSSADPRLVGARQDFQFRDLLDEGRGLDAVRVRTIQHANADFTHYDDGNLEELLRLLVREGEEEVAIEYLIQEIAARDRDLPSGHPGQAITRMQLAKFLLEKETRLDQAHQLSKEALSVLEHNPLANPKTIQELKQMIAASRQ